MESTVEHPMLPVEGEVTLEQQAAVAPTTESIDATSATKIEETAVASEQTITPKAIETSGEAKPPAKRQRQNSARQNKDYYIRNEKPWRGDGEGPSNENNREKVSRKERDGNSSGEDVEGGEKRLPKRKVAVMLGFCGSKYQGMQINPNAKTIEGELIRALVEVGAISKDNSSDPKKVALMRAARTDKGVHAAGQVVSIKLIVEDEKLVEKLNQTLDPEIRVYGIRRVANSFHAKTHCDSRMYEYLLPSYALMPAPPSTPSTSAAASESDIPSDTSAWATWDSNVAEIPVLSEKELAEQNAFRVSADALEKLNQCLKAFVGSRNFHNYTLRKNFHETNATRFIKSFTAGEPKVIDGMEWISLKIHGQSFMLHQIRKMVAMCVLIVRYDAPITLIPRTFANVRINIPKAPGFGLLLERPVFNNFNKKQLASNKMGVEFVDYQDEMEAFKLKHIYDKLVNEEREKHSFAGFLSTVHAHIRTAFGYINPEGVIPESAIVPFEAGQGPKLAPKKRRAEKDEDEIEEDME